MGRTRYDDNLHQFLEKHFWLLAAVPILFMAGLQAGSIRQESATFDEGVHLAAGYRYWQTGKFNLNVEHPPLQKLLSALPLLFVQPPLPADPKLLPDQSEFARAFLYEGPIGADRLLLLGRWPTIIMSILLAVSAAWAGRRYFGGPAGLVTVWFCALDPNLIAHGRYVTNDVASSLFYFIAVILWLNFLRAPARGRAILAALALGLALATKFSMLLLPLVFVLLLIGQWLLQWRSWRTAGRGAAAFAGVCLLALVVLLASYGPESWRTIRGRKIGVEAETIQGIALPPHTYLTGVRTLIDHNSSGHAAFLLGEVSEKGWWYYFPVVFAVKSSTATLALLLAAACVALWNISRLFQDRAATFLWMGLVVPPAAYFGVTMTSHINLGVRHLLPIYPFLYLICAALLARALPVRAFGLVAISLMAAHAGETFAAYPEFLGFFNRPSGGPKAGPNYLLDSNVDWGQDLKKLKVYIDRNPGTVCLEYFGSPPPKYYGIQYEYLPRTWDKDDLERMDCVGAISVTLLRDLYIRPGSFEWLRKRSPIGVVGSSIYLYDLRKAKRP